MAALTKAHPVRKVLHHTWLLAATVFVITGLIYWFSAKWLDRTDSPDTAYFNYLADAFLQGRLYLAHPAARYDLTQYQGKWYVPSPPYLPCLCCRGWRCLVSAG